MTGTALWRLSRPGDDLKVNHLRRSLAIFAVPFAVLFAVSGCTSKAIQPTAPGTPPPAPAVVTASPGPALITVPNVVGKNAAVAADELKKLGFTNVGFGTVDGRPAVVLPENWTVKTQSAQPGDRLQANAKIVLGCARNG
jgi:hypothetical protein